MSARRTVAALACAAALLLVLLPAAALAGGPGRWTPVSAADGDNTDQVGLLRTPDGTLHVVWRRKTPGDPTSADLLQTLVSPAGAVGAPQAVASGWRGIGDPAIVQADGGGIMAIFAGATQSLEIGAPDGIVAWQSGDGGRSWNAPVLVSPRGGFSDDVGATVDGGGIPFFGWGQTGGLFVHRGTIAAAGESNFQSAAGFDCCGYSPGFARDGASGQIVVAWYSNATGHDGVYAQAVDSATGAPVGSPALMPGSATRFDGQLIGSYSLAHTPVVSRPGKPGVFVAYAGGYPSTTKVLVWRFGASRSTTVAQRSTDVGDVGVAAGPAGRLWAFWSFRGRIYARRSNPQLSRWGATVSVRPPKGTGTIYKLAGSAQASRLDLLGAFQPNGGSGVQTWHTQLLAGLELAAKPARLTAGRGVQKLTLRVTDAGAGVGGATVRLGHAKRRTNGKGAATFAVGPFAKRATLVATAAKRGWTGARVVVRVR